MADPPPPGSPARGSADDASGSDTGRSNTAIRDTNSSQDIEGSPDSTDIEGNVADDDETVSESENGDDIVSENDLEDQEAPVANDILQMLAEETPGEFDFDSDDDDDIISLIQCEGDYMQMIQDYERANDRLERVDDFPTDPAELQRYIREIARALVNFDGAIDLTTEAGKPTPAVNRIKKLKKSEIGLLAGMALSAILKAQQGRSRGAYGDEQNLHPQKFDSWKDRYQVVLGNLKIVKNNVFNLIKGRESFAYKFAAHPKETRDRQNWNRAGNKKKAGKLAMVKAAQQQSSPSSGAKTTSTATGNTQDQSILNALRSIIAQEARDGQEDAGPSHPTGTKRQQSSMAPNESAKPPATSNAGIEASPYTSAVDRTSGASSAHESMKTSRQPNRNVASTSSALSGPSAKEGGTPARTDAPQPAAPLSEVPRAILKYRADQLAKAAGSAPRTPLPDRRGHKPQPRPPKTELSVADRTMGAPRPPPERIAAATRATPPVMPLPIPPRWWLAKYSKPPGGPGPNTRDAGATGPPRKRQKRESTGDGGDGSDDSDGNDSDGNDSDVSDTAPEDYDDGDDEDDAEELEE